MDSTTILPLAAIFSDTKPPAVFVEFPTCHYTLLTLVVFDHNQSQTSKHGEKSSEISWLYYGRTELIDEFHMCSFLFLTRLIRKWSNIINYSGLNHNNFQQLRQIKFV